MQMLINIIMILHVTRSAKILGFFPAPCVSHQKSFQPIWRELSLRGHKVVSITPNILGDPTLTNLTEIDVEYAYDFMSEGLEKRVPRENYVARNVLALLDLGLDIMEAEIDDVKVRALLNDSKEDFDLVVHGLLFVPLGLAFGAKYKVPTVAISSLGVFLHTHDAFGNPTHPLVSPDVMLNFEGDLTFANKIESLLYNIWYRMIYYWYALPKADKIARKYFGDDIPYLGDIERNTSLLLMNVNPLIHGVRPNVPNVIEINQIHIKKKKPLPEDIQKYLDSSPQGVVYFSLGSNVKSANLTTLTRNVIIQALADLPYNVIWKWETDFLPGKPDNVMIGKWFPQQDVLGHRNIKAFVTQGGLQSIEEAITNEVPMVGLPFITDQPLNIKRIVNLGIGLGLDHRTLTKEQLRNAIIEVAENKKYKEQVKKSRAILVDQPMKGVEKAVWWIEYVLRHKGAKHLRSAAADMSFFEYFMIDVVMFLLVCVSLFTYAIIQLTRLLVWLTKKTQKVKTH